MFKYLNSKFNIERCSNGLSLDTNIPLYLDIETNDGGHARRSMAGLGSGSVFDF